MKNGILHELKSSSLLFLWLLLAQTICALFTLFASALVLMGMILGGTLALSGHTPLWVYIAGSALICLFWLTMGRIAPDAVRPGPVGTVAVLAVWVVLTSLVCGLDLVFLGQSFCGGMLEEILLFFHRSPWFDQWRAMTMGCVLLPAVFGTGLLLGWKREKRDSIV